MKEIKIKTKNILVPVIVFIIIGIICWSWVLIDQNDIPSALKCSFLIAFLQYVIIRINEHEFTSIDNLGVFSILLWIMSLFSAFTGLITITWIVITFIFYCTAVYKNFRAISEVIERRKRLYQ